MNNSKPEPLFQQISLSYTKTVKYTWKKNLTDHLYKLKNNQITW